MGDVFRVTTYQIGTGDFPGAKFRLNLRETLSTHYFVMIRPTPTGTSTVAPRDAFVRVTADPYGTSELDTSIDNYIELSRYDDGTALTDWTGTVTVVECLRDYDGAGFRLLDVVDTPLALNAGTGIVQDSDGANVAWKDPARIVPFGGVGGGGVAFTSGGSNATEYPSGGIRVYPSGSNTLNFERYAPIAGSLDAVVVTTYVVEFGDEWDVRRATMRGTAGGADTNAIGEYVHAGFGADPRTLSQTLWGWWDAHDESTFTFSGGTTISAIADKSGSGNHMNVLVSGAPVRTASNANVNNTPTIDFTSDVIKTTATKSWGDFTVIIAFRITTAASFEVPIGTEWPTGWQVSRDSSTANRFGLGVRESSPPYGTHTTEFLDTEVHIYAGRRSGTTRTQFNNGVIVSEDAVNDVATLADSVALGGEPDGSEAMTSGSIIEAMVFDGALTNAEIRAQSDRIAAKIRGINTPAKRTDTWLWWCGWTADDGAGDSWTGALVTLGDGVTNGSTELLVAVGLGVASIDKRFDVYALSHPSCSTTWSWHATGDGTAQTYDYTVASPAMTEARGTDSYGVAYTQGGRFATQTASNTSTATTTHSEALWCARHTADTTAQVARGDSSPSVTWAAWLQNVDLGAIMSKSMSDQSPVFRVTHYRIDGEFTTDTYDLVLLNDLADDYFVMITGSRGDSSSAALRDDGLRVTQDPNGTGDLAVSGADNQIRLARDASAAGAWTGTITVVECLQPSSPHGFRLRDVKALSCATMGASTGLQTTTGTLNTSASAAGWRRVVPFGGPRGGGWTSTSSSTSATQSPGATFELTDRSTLKAVRYAPASSTALDVVFTTYIVEFGGAWVVQQARFDGVSIGGAGTYETTKLGVPVDPDTTWVWGSSATAGTTQDKTWDSLAVHLGTGAAQADPEDDVSITYGGAVASVYAVIYTMTNPMIAVDWRSQSSTAKQYVFPTIDAVVGGESYGVTQYGVRYTLGTRFLGAYCYSSSTGVAMRSTALQVTPSGETTALVQRDYFDGSFVGWYESVDLGGVFDDTATASDTPGPTAYLVIPDANYAGAASFLSATSQAGGYCGSAVPTSTNLGVGVAFQSGTPSGTTEFEYRVTQGGAISRPTGDNAGYNIGSWVWRRSGETPYKSLNGVTLLRAPNPVSTGSSEYAVAVCYSSAYNRALIARITNSTTITIYYRDVNTSNTTTWSSTTATVTDARTGFAVTAPGLEIVELPSGRLLMFYTAAGSTGSNTLAGDVMMYASDDGGLTWTFSQSALFARTPLFASVADSTYALGGQLRADASGDWVRLTSIQNLSSAVDNLRLYTIVSPDRGNSWKGVGVNSAGTFSSVSVYSCQSAANATIGSFPWSIVGVGDTSGTFLLACITATENTIRIYSAQRDGDWTAQSSLDLVYTSSTVRRGTTQYTSAVIRGLCFVRTADAIWLYWWAEGTNGSEIYAHVIDPNNPLDSASWVAMGPISMFSGSLKYGPYHWQGDWCGNHVLFANGLLNPDTTVRTNDPLKAGMYTAVIGGWDTRPVVFSRREAYSQWSVPRGLWIQWHAAHGQIGPVADADADANTTWTYTSAGTGAKSWTAQWAVATATSTTGTSYWTDTSSGTNERVAANMTFDVLVEATRLAAASGLDSGIRIRPYSATAGYKLDFTLRMDTTTIVVYDNNGAAVRATLSSVPLSTGIELRVAWYQNTLEVSYRAHGTSGETDVTTSGPLTMTGGGAHGANTIDAGVLSTTASGTTSTIKFRTIMFATAWNGQLSSYVTRPNDLIGALLTTGSIYVADGISVRWGGGGAIDGDTHTGNLEYTRGLTSFGVDSPRVYWESSSLAANSIVLDAGSASKRWVVDALALVGTVDRTVVFEINDADSWTSPLFRTTIDADVWPSLRVAAVDGHAVKIATTDGTLLPKRGETIDLYLRFVSAGSASGKTYAVLGAPDANGWVTLDTTDDLATTGVTVGATVAVYASRMVWRGDAFQRGRYMRITFPSLATGGTSSGTHRLGAVVPGTAVDFDVPMDWVWRDSEQPNVSEVRTRGGMSWHYEEGPPQRVISGRVIGDVDDRQRDQLRGLLGKVAGYSVKPVVLVVDPDRAPATSVYGRWVTGSMKDNAGWFRDVDGTWHTVGDLDVSIVEEP